MIAIFEAVKGVLAVIAGFGLLSLINQNLIVFAGELVETLHLNSESHLAHQIVETATSLDPANLRVFIGISLLYASLRFVEAYGLWRLRAWAEWFAIISGSVYVPIEVYEILRKPTWIRMLILFLNVAIVLYLYSFQKESKQAEQRI